MEWIINAPKVQRWVQRYEDGTCILTSSLDDALMFKTFKEASDELVKIGRNDLEINGHLYEEDLWYKFNK